MSDERRVEVALRDIIEELAYLALPVLLSGTQRQRLPAGFGPKLCFDR